MFPGKAPFVAAAGVVFTLLIAVGLPVALAVFCREKLKSKWSPLIWGIIIFPVFAFVLEQMLHSFMFNTFGEALTGNVVLFALYGGLAAGLFEESGRWVAKSVLMHRQLSAENSIMYGVGHGGIEALLLIVPTYIANLSAIAVYVVRLYKKRAPRLGPQRIL